MISSSKRKKRSRRTNLFTATVFLVYPSSVEIFELPFQGPEEKHASFAGVVRLAVQTSAIAIISSTDQFVKDLRAKGAGEQFLRRYRLGDIEAEKTSEALGIIVSPRDGADWGLSAPYTRTGRSEMIVYGRARSNTRTPYVNSLVPESWKAAARAKAVAPKTPSSGKGKARPSGRK